MKSTFIMPVRSKIRIKPSWAGPKLTDVRRDFVGGRYSSCEIRGCPQGLP